MRQIPIIIIGNPLFPKYCMVIPISKAPVIPPELPTRSNAALADISDVFGNWLLSSELNEICISPAQIPKPKKMGNMTRKL